MHAEKVICLKLLQINSMEEENLQLFTLFLPVTFLLANVLHFFQQFRNQRKIFVLIPIFKFCEKKFLGHISTFLKL